MKSTPKGDKRRATILRLLRHAENYDTWLTVQEIAADTDLSKTATYQHLMRLRADALVTWKPGLARTLRLTAKGRRP